MGDDTHPNAGRASGYVDEAGNKIGEDLVNRVTGIVTEYQVKTDLKVDAFLRAQEERDQRRYDHELRERAALLKKIDRQLGQYPIDGQKLDQILRVVEEIAPRLGKLESRMNASEADRKQMNDRLARIETVLAARPDQREKEHQAIIDAVVEQLKQAGDGGG
jgi:hypothetical protein